MIVNLIKEKQIFSITLPEKVKGQYWVNDFDGKGAFRQLISIEAINGKWWIKSNRNVSVLGEKLEKIDDCELSDNSYFNLKIADSSEKVVLFTESVDPTRQTLSKIVAEEAAVFTIGRSEESSFCFNNAFVSYNHAKLFFDGNDWSIEDLDSKNGTYVNGIRVDTQKLRAGDYIYIMGLKIVVGSNYLAINNPDMRVKIKATSLCKYKKQLPEFRESSQQDEGKNYFTRSPRFYRDVCCEEINIDPPPQAEKLDTVPMALMLGPSLTMAMTSVSTGIISATNVISNGGNISQALPTLIMSVSMLLGTVLWPILTKKHEKKQKIKSEKRRQEKYFTYLSEIGDRISDVAKLQSQILNETFVSQEDCLERIIRIKPSLWERTVEYSDFLRLRLGVGTMAMNVNVKYQEKKFTMYDDNLQNAMLALAETPKVLNDVPISISLRDNATIGIYGGKDDCNDMILSLILQIVALHGYDEVKIALISDKEEAATWNFAKYLPHIWSNDKTARFCAYTPDDVKDLSYIIEKELLARSSVDNYKKKLPVPHYVFIITSATLRNKFSILKGVLGKDDIGVTTIMTGDNFNSFPKETRTIIHANGKKSKIFDKNDTSGKQVCFEADTVNRNVMENMSAKLANIELDLAEKNYVLPNMLTFLEMFNVGKVDHLNSLTRWRENNPTKSLKTPIGVGSEGDTFILDLHEKYHGPHGLVAGMTGSGKSEFIITYILSLAVNYHPDEVAFILIDYKGGGLTGAFENADTGIKLPHLAGTITNLDGAAITRSLVSIQSELKRRQTIFNAARKVSNEGTMDIYKYQKLYREKLVKEPLPHLFIISDEFAELKTQQPEFMEQLISAARIGRSLGVHLILATQKPSGVVDDQIWSNSKFKVCLKVQEKSDSQDMIKCPDAAELSQTGRFYLQVGFNELFALGQSAWCGADYVPSDVVEKPVDDSIQVVDTMGRSIISVKPEKKVAVSNGNKQIVSIVKYLSDLASDEGIEVRPLWLDPIPSHIYVEQLEKKYKREVNGIVLDPIVGEYDDPFNQKQDVLTMSLSSEGNCLIFGATGSGKTTFITTLCYTLIKNHTPEELNIYLMDYGSETLRSFEKAPHVGGVVTSADTEKCINLIKMLLKEIESRRKLFSDFGGDYASYCKNSGKLVPNIVVVLNNYSGFYELMEDYQDDMQLLTRDGVKFGIYFVVTATNHSDIRYRVQQNFGQILTMQLNDVNDYSMIVGRTEGVIPSKFKGRGLVALDRVYEFQTAYCTDREDTLNFIREFCGEQAKKYAVTAKQIPILPEIVNVEFFERSIGSINELPIGVAKETLEIITYNLGKKVVLPVLSQDINDNVAFAEGISTIISRICKTKVIDTEKVLNIDADLLDSRDGASIVLEIFNEMVKRNNHYKDANMDISVLDEYEELCYVIFGVKHFFDQLDDESKEKMQVLLEKADPAYKIHFVFCDSVADIKKLEYDEWFKMHISGADGIWIGDGVADQYVFKINKMTSGLYDEIGTNFGYAAYKGKPILVKLLSSGRE